MKAAIVGVIKLRELTKGSRKIGRIYSPSTFPDIDFSTYTSLSIKIFITYIWTIKIYEIWRMD